MHGDLRLHWQCVRSQVVSVNPVQDSDDALLVPIDLGAIIYQYSSSRWSLYAWKMSITSVRVLDPGDVPSLVSNRT